MTPMPIFRELVEHHPLPTAARAALVKAVLAGAVFADHCLVSIRGGHFVAEFPFITPIGPERQDSVVIMLGLVPERERQEGEAA